MAITRNLLGCIVVPLLIVLLELTIGATLQLAVRTDKASVREIDRRHVVNARLAPYTAVGKFKGAMTCTAAIVLDPRIIVTAAHCIMERDGTIRQSDLSFQPAYQFGSNHTRVNASVWAIGSKQSVDQESVGAAARDWAILVLDRAPAGVQPFILGPASLGAQELSRLQFRLPAYSDDVAGAEVLSVDPACTVHDLVWDTLIHNCLAGRGSSGAPLLVREEQGYAVVGIHAASIFESDQRGHVARFVGGQAIGSWMFATAAQALSRQLSAESNLTINSGEF